MKKHDFVVYGGTAHHKFDDAVLKKIYAQTSLKLRFSHFWHNTYADGEPGSFPSDHHEIPGRHAIIFGCPISDRLQLQLYDSINACREYKAKSITVILSFLRYRRQDRLEKEGEITRLKWFISDLANSGVNDLVVCEPHSPERTMQYCQEFGINLWIADPTLAWKKAVKKLQKSKTENANFCIYAPDLGALKRAQKLAKECNLDVLLTPKQRTPDGRVKRLRGDEIPDEAKHNSGSQITLLTDKLDAAKDRHIIMRDDEISTGGTCVMIARELQDVGAASTHLFVTHPVCAPGWKLTLFPPDRNDPFDSVWIGNTRPRGLESEYEGSTGSRVKTVDMAGTTAIELAKIIRLKSSTN